LSEVESHIDKIFYAKNKPCEELYKVKTLFEVESNININY